MDRIEQLLHKEQKYKAVIFAGNQQVEENTIGWVDNMFGFNIKALHDALQLDTELFIYLDRSYDCYNDDIMFQNFLSINRQMVESYCDYFKKQYTILYLYNIIGYKFKSYQTEIKNVNNILEHERKLIFNSKYKYVHFIYIRDILDVIMSLVSKQQEINKEEHMRYNNTGFDIEKLIYLFEELNSEDYVFTYKKLTIGNKIAPCSGKPSNLLSKKEINPDHWIRAQQKANYY